MQAPSRRARGLKPRLLVAALGLAFTAFGCAGSPDGGGTAGSAGSNGSAGSSGPGGAPGSTAGTTGSGSGGTSAPSGAAGTSGGSGVAGSSGGTSGVAGSSGGSGATSGGAGTSGGTTGGTAGSKGGTAGGSTAGSTGAAGTKGGGGAAGTGAAGTGAAGAAGSKAGTTGTGTAGTTGAGGAAGAFVPPWTCQVPTWPTATGSAVSISSTMQVAKSYDGKMALHNGSGSGDFGVDCSAMGTKDQGTTKPLFELADGATIQNVIVGNHGADGIHCDGTCTIKNVWFNYVCDDAVTAAAGSSGTVTIDGGGAQGAHDKLFQDNSHGKFIIQNFFGQRLGKMYRACGVGGACGSTKGNLTITNTVAIGVD